jgi:hypothetical protein
MPKKNACQILKRLLIHRNSLSNVKITKIKAQLFSIQDYIAMTIINSQKFTFGELMVVLRTLIGKDVVVVH